MSLRSAIESGEFAVTSEVGPPKGTDISHMLETAEMLHGRVHAFNVTDNQAAVMRLSTLAACIHLKQHGFDPVLQVTCRDRNRLALQSDLLGAASFGIENVLALTGDHVVVGDHPERRPSSTSSRCSSSRRSASSTPAHDMAGNELDGHAGLLRRRGRDARRQSHPPAAREVREEASRRRAVLPDAGRLRCRALPRVHGVRARAWARRCSRASSCFARRAWRAS